ncbi:aromatic ring-hydroxylating dioxygenase subunit alpha [Nostoc sp. TCL26-01]|uniref:aromatic ring-hydroxylating dioxygenase subunit alpha n=1 Tax=Nostoc sp. TCL26-01 TaxID=2576904 RepID=UPI0015BC80C9|nr:aromatic ring-hydroxylating dioxygenase subunit alpha [Nostoc sp. TCL26-01]QLE57323.1 aromatic ring-hydroxylating dioxygenase subunit alpha [Nostoc sp. TCL26-01]
MDVNSQNIKSIRQPKIFNHPERFIEGWYWVIPSQSLSIGEVKPVTILGKNLVIYRGKNRRVVIGDAYCPHMGAHLAKGEVVGNELRCGFHHWQFNSEGICVDIPCLAAPLPLKLKTWPTVERYGGIWVWTGETPKQTLPFVPELELQELVSGLGSSFVVDCHPSILMTNAIDTQHFQAIHKLPLEMSFDKQELHQNAIIFHKNKCHNKSLLFIRFFRPLYKNPVYSICYWYGSTFTVTVGTDSLRLHLMMTLRLVAGNKVAVQPIFLTKKRRGFTGWLFNRFVLWLTYILLHYFLKDDVQILETMQFDLRTPIKADQPIMQLIHHVERQKPLAWKTWLLARSPDTPIPENQTKWRDEMTND